MVVKLAYEIDYQALLNAAPHPLLALDGSTRILFSNDAFHEAFQVSPLLIVGNFLQDLGPPWDHSSLRRLVTDVVEGRKKRGELRIEAEFPRIGKRVFAFRLRRSAEKAEGGAVALLSIDELTGTVEMARQSQHISEDLEKANKILEEFAFLAAHDLQTPLRKIMLFSELASAKLANGCIEEATHAMNSIQSQAQDMVMIVRDLLRLGELNKDQRTDEEVPLADVVECAQELLSDQLAACEARVEIGRLPVVRGSRTNLTQLFVNLIDNAVRYRKSDSSPLIQIRAISHTNGVKVLVRDHGIGFDQKYAEAIFQPFRRLRINDATGTGLGLTICSRIMESFEGRIKAKSVPGVGATFLLYFPESALANRPRYDL